MRQFEIEITNIACIKQQLSYPLWTHKRTDAQGSYDRNSGSGALNAGSRIIENKSMVFFPSNSSLCFYKGPPTTSQKKLVFAIVAPIGHISKIEDRIPKQFRVVDSKTKLTTL